MNDFISYIDTDSLFLMFGSFLEHQGVNIDKWNALSQDIKSKMLIKLSKAVEKVVNDRSYHEIQRGDYNSLVDVDDFSISFKQEIVCSNILHLGPKMYAFHTVNNEGFDCDRVDAKGIEIVRSSSPRVFRNALKELLKNLLKGESDEVLSGMVENHKKIFKSSPPEDISINTSVNNLNQYINEDFEYKKGTPYHIKGVANYHYLINNLGLTHKYEYIKEGDKCKVVYLKKNRYGFDVISYYRWPEEFSNAGISVDYNIMIDKHFTAKAHILLDPINRQDILKDRSVMDMFF